jgi:hypothetical protein
MPSENEAFGSRSANERGPRGESSAASFGGSGANAPVNDQGGRSNSGGSVAASAATGGAVPSGGVPAVSAGETASGATSSGATSSGATSSGSAATGGAAGDGGTRPSGTGGAGASGGSVADAGAIGIDGGGAGEGGAGTTSGSGGGGFDAELGLVAHFAFDEPSGALVGNSSDPRRNGRCVGICTRPSGRFGRAIGIRNSGSVDYVELPRGLLNGLSMTTMSLWVRDLSITRQGGRLFHFSSGSAEEIFFSPDDVNPRNDVRGAHLGGRHRGASFVNLWTTSPLTDRQWHQVAFTWSAASINLYVDGRALRAQSTPDALPSDLGATDPDWLGRTLNDAAITLYVEIDDLRIYNRVLSANEVAALYSARDD